MEEFDDAFDTMVDSLKLAVRNDDKIRKKELEAEMTRFYVEHMMWDYKLWFPKMSESDLIEAERIFF